MRDGTQPQAAGGAAEFYFLVCQFRKLRQQRNFHLDAESFELKLEHENVNMAFFNIGLDIIIIIKVVLVLKVEKQHIYYRVRIINKDNFLLK